MVKDYFNRELAIEDKRLFLLDMDGTIYLGNDIFDDTIQFLSNIKKQGASYIFITNNSSKDVLDYVKKLHRIGIKDAKVDDFYTSAMCAATILKEKFHSDKIYVQGTKSFVEGLLEDGLNVTTHYEEDVKCVLVGFDLELSMRKLETTCKLLTKLDVPYFATNPDWVCPTSWGYTPDCGSMCFAIEKATGKRPIFIGKPNSTMLEYVMKKYNKSKEETILLGDRLYTDIASANKAGIDSVLMLTGETTLDMVKRAPFDQRPNYVFNRLKDMF